MQSGKDPQPEKLPAKPLSHHKAGKPAPRTKEITAPAAEYPASSLTATTSVLDRLTPDQLDVLRLIATPMSADDVAKERGTSVAAIDKHLELTFRKLEVNTRADAIAIYGREREAASDRDRQLLRQENARLRQELAEAKQDGRIAELEAEVEALLRLVEVLRRNPRQDA